MAFIRSHRKRRKIREGIKWMLIISGICLIVATFISFMIGSLPSFVEKTVSKQIEGEIERTIGKNTSMEEVAKKYKKYFK